MTYWFRRIRSWRCIHRRLWLRVHWMTCIIDCLLLCRWHGERFWFRLWCGNRHTSHRTVWIAGTRTHFEVIAQARFFFVGWNDGVAMRSSVVHLNDFVIAINHFLVIVRWNNRVSLRSVRIHQNHRFADEIGGKGWRQLSSSRLIVVVFVIVVLWSICWQTRETILFLETEFWRRQQIKMIPTSRQPNRTCAAHYFRLIGRYNCVATFACAWQFSQRNECISFAAFFEHILSSLRWWLWTRLRWQFPLLSMHHYRCLFASRIRFCRLQTAHTPSDWTHRFTSLRSHCTIVCRRFIRRWCGAAWTRKKLTLLAKCRICVIVTRHFFHCTLNLFTD